MSVNLRYDGFGAIGYGFPFNYITFNYSPFEGLSGYMPADITPFVWIRNIGATWSRSSVSILGAAANFIAYYAIVLVAKNIIIKLKLKMRHS